MCAVSHFINNEIYLLVDIFIKCVLKEMEKSTCICVKIFAGMGGKSVTFFVCSNNVGDLAYNTD